MLRPLSVPSQGTVRVAGRFHYAPGRRCSQPWGGLHRSRAATLSFLDPLQTRAENHFAHGLLQRFCKTLIHHRIMPIIRKDHVEDNQPGTAANQSFD